MKEMKLPDDRNKWMRRVIWYRLDRKVILNKMSVEYLNLLYCNLIDGYCKDLNITRDQILFINVGVEFDMFKKYHNKTITSEQKEYKDSIKYMGDMECLLKDIASFIRDSYDNYEKYITRINSSELSKYRITKKGKEVYHINQRMTFHLIKKSDLIEKKFTWYDKIISFFKK